jgi:hypothetical protein
LANLFSAAGVMSLSSMINPDVGLINLGKVKTIQVVNAAKYLFLALAIPNQTLYSYFGLKQELLFVFPANMRRFKRKSLHNLSRGVNHKQYKLR